MGLVGSPKESTKWLNSEIGLKVATSIVGKHSIDFEYEEFYLEHNLDGIKYIL